MTTLLTSPLTDVNPAAAPAERLRPRCWPRVRGWEASHEKSTIVPGQASRSWK